MSLQISFDLESRREVLCEHRNVFSPIPVCSQASNTKKRITRNIKEKKCNIGIKRTIYFPFHLSLSEIILSPHRILNSNEMLHFKEFLHYLKKEI